MPMPLLMCRRVRLVLLLWIAGSHGDSSDDTYDPSMCLNEPSTCGSVSFSYPFYLAGKTKDLKGNADSYCGYPGLGIFCEDEKATLRLNGTANYTVKRIDGALATVSLADPEVDDAGPCPRPRINSNVTLQQGSLQYFSDSTVDYLIFFIDCTFNSTFPQPNYISPISCEGFARPGPELSFVLPDDAVLQGNWVQACSKVIELPVHKYGAIKINHTDPRWTNSGYAQLLRQDFQLGWNDSVKPPACIQCEEYKGRCGYNRTGDFISCLCPDGRSSSNSTVYCDSTGKFFEYETFLCTSCVSTCCAAL